MMKATVSRKVEFKKSLTLTFQFEIYLESTTELNHRNIIYEFIESFMRITNEELKSKGDTYE